MRIEDLDGPRIKSGAAEAALDTLRWVGIDWDGDTLVQSEDLRPYVEAMQSLASRGMAYPSDLSRTEIEAAASAPQDVGAAGGEVRFPASLRPPFAARTFDEVTSNWRFVTPDDEVRFVDAFAGAQARRPSESIGDFVIWTKRGQPSYQLAVVVDDHRQGVTQVVRGDDLLDSAARQMLLYRALGYREQVAYLHLPLVVGEDGRRLAKRHGDTRVAMYREAGVAVERVVGLMAYWCGLTPQRTMMRADEFASRLDVSRMPREQVVFRAEDDRWLRE